MIMNRRLVISGIVALAVFSGCKNEEWDKHYNSPVETINMNVWDAIQKEEDLSKFVQYIKDFDYDTLFLKDDGYTLFAPTNAAFAQLTAGDTITAGKIAYHISKFFIQSGNIKGKRKVETLNKKFALFDNNGSHVIFDEVSLDYESPLYVNGKFFKMSKVAEPKPNLYEYIANTNPVLKKYIDSQDSIILDKELSRPIGFDKFGNTIYDTVSIKYNKFEEKFFPVSEEFRFQTATLVFPREEDYNSALDSMALFLGGDYTSHEDISIDWQNKILIPYLLEYGVFENMVEPYEFTLVTSLDTIKMKNILGDSIIIKYEVTDKTLCSNGYAYNYAHFLVPDTLFASKSRFETETLLKEIGISRYAWRPVVSVINDEAFAPSKILVPDASNDTIMNVNFTKGYTGAFTIEFNIDNIFPRKYLMVMGTNANLGGIYNIYVNDVLVKNYDWYSYVLNKNVYRSVTGKRYQTKNGFNIVDCYVDNLTTYGETRIKFEYVGPGKVLNNGLSLDYIEFVPQ
jgi:uncharacterized surface protein with fasciclin (FAS1) repeats